MKTLRNQNLFIAMFSFALISLTLSSCDRHHCPTYSHSQEKHADNQS